MEQIFVKVPRSTYLTVLTPFLMSSEEPEPADCISQSLLRVCVSLSTSLYIHFSPNSHIYDFYVSLKSGTTVTRHT